MGNIDPTLFHQHNFQIQNLSKSLKEKKKNLKTFKPINSNGQVKKKINSNGISFFNFFKLVTHVEFMNKGNLVTSHDC